MAGPTTLIFGAFPFQSIGFSFQDLSRNIDTDWSDVRIAQGWDTLQWLGPTKEEAEIKGVLFPEAMGGLSNLDGIRGMAVAGTPGFLISLGGNVMGLFVCRGVREDQGTFNAQGTPRRDAYRIHLRRYESASPVDALSSLVRLFG